MNLHNRFVIILKDKIFLFFEMDLFREINFVTCIDLLHFLGKLI